MPFVDLKFSGYWWTELVVEFRGNRETSRVLVDSGFYNDAFGLILPSKYLPSAVPRGTTRFSAPDGTPIVADFVESGEVLRMGGRWLTTPLKTPVAFLDADHGLLGTKFLKDWKTTLDGPGKCGRIELP